MVPLPGLFPSSPTQTALHNLQMLQAYADKNGPCFCQDLYFKTLCLSFFAHTFLTPLSPSIQRHHWTAKCLSGHPGVCVWAPAPEGASATAHVTSSCGRPTLASPALSWRNRLNAYRTAVWDSSNPRGAHEHRYCQYSTLGLSCYHCWTEIWCCIFSISLIMQRICVFVTVKLWEFKTYCPLVLECTLFWEYFNGNKGKVKACSRALDSYYLR